MFGNVLVLIKFDPADEKKAMACAASDAFRLGVLLFRVKYILQDYQIKDLKEGYCVMQLEPVR